MTDATRCRVLGWTSLAFGGVLTVYLTIIFQIMPGWTLAKGVAAGAITTFFLLFLAARSARFYTPLAITFIATAMSTTTLAAIGNDGVEGYVAPFLIVGPLAAGYFLTVRAALVTGVIAVLALVGLFALDVAGVVTPTPYSEGATRLASLILLSTVCVLSLVCVLAFAGAAHRMLCEASKADAAKSAFLANMSHEIRTPMNGVIGVLDLLMQSRLEPKDRDYLMTASASAQALIAILDDILDHAKLEAGKINLETLPVDPRSSCREVVDLFSARANMKRIKLQMSASDDVPATVCVDPTRLRQILWNLVGNAIKFTEAGSVEIALAYECNVVPNRLRVEVRDTGCGISEEAQRNVFDRFAQEDGSTTRRFGGTGLGLTICKKLVDLMGGEIGVVSTPERGSTFWFALDAPMAECQAPEEIAPEPQTADDAASLFILVVDDQLTNRMVLKALLNNLGHECLIVDSGQAAIDAVEVAEFDAIFTDIHMPDMDGLETTRAIRAMGGHHATVPIVAVTASALREEQQTYFDAGMDDCLAKPVDLKSLTGILGRLHARLADMSGAAGASGAEPRAGVSDR